MTTTASTTPTRALRAGLIGLGSMGRNHARTLASLPGVNFVAVCDPARDAAGAALGRSVVGSVEDLVRAGLDYCVVAAPTGLHEAIGLQLADAGVHMLVEKPVAGDSAAAGRLVEAFARAGLVGAVGHIERYNPALQSLKARLESGDLGEIYQIATRRQGPFPARIADVGVALDLATHDLDLTAFVTGERYVSISARTAYKSGRAHEDLIAATGTLSRGTVANHLVNWLSPQKERVTIVTGERGTFTASTLTGDLTFAANGTVESVWDDVAHFRGVSEGDVIRYALAKPEPLRVEHEAFRDAVLGDPKAPIVPLDGGLAAVAVAEAIIASARSGDTVTVRTAVATG